MKSPNVERNAAIISMRKSGVTLRKVGETFGLSGEYVRWICLNYELKQKEAEARAVKKELHYRTLTDVPVTSNTLIGDVALSTRLYNALREERIATIGQAAQMTDRELLRVYNLGKKSLRELREVTAHL